MGRMCLSSSLRRSVLRDIFFVYYLCFLKITVQPPPPRTRCVRRINGGPEENSFGGHCLLPDRCCALCFLSQRRDAIIKACVCVDCCLCVYLSTCLAVNLYACLSVCACLVCLFLLLHVLLSLSFCLSDFVCLYPSICPSASVSFSLSISVS